MTKDIKLANIRFTKISAERNLDYTGKPSIKPKLNISNIEKLKEGKTEAISVYFKFGINYSELGNIDLEGKIILLMDSKLLKETIKSWDSKTLDNDTHLIILNIIMQKASLKAIQLEEELGLPLHINIPRLKLNSKK